MTTGLHDREVATRFDAEADRFKRDVADGDHRLAALARGLAGMERPLVLDLGCGKGRFARQITRRGAEVVGLDLSARMLGEADGFARVRGTGRRLPFASGVFDAVVAVECLQHLGETGATLDEARRVLRPGGRFLIVDKNVAALDVRRPWMPCVVMKRIDEYRGRWMYPAGGPVRERWFAAGGLKASLRRRFERVSVEYLLSPDEARLAVFRQFPAIRATVCWTATVPARSES